MPTALLTPKRTLLIAAGLLLVNSLLPLPYATKLARPLETIIVVPVGFASAPLVSLGSAMRGGDAGEVRLTGGDETQWDRLQAEYGQALQLNRQLEARLKEAQAQIEQLTQSRSIALEGVSLVDARVTGYSDGGGVKPTLTIDRGTNKNIHEQTAVVSGFNLVGRIDAAYPLSSEVALITATAPRKTKLMVRILPPLAAAPREFIGGLELAENGKEFTLTVTRDDPIEVGDLAHLADDGWPSEAIGFVVGQVVSVEPDPTNPLNRKRVIVRPMKPLETLTRVTALVPVE